jgi:hypothetical protein
MRKPKNTKLKECLDGIQELRDAVRWADGQPEYTHDWCTAEQVLKRYRKAMTEE